MIRRRVAGFLVMSSIASSAVACGREDKTLNRSCCFYECGGDRTVFFSQFFGSEEECQGLAESRCAIEFDQPEDQEVVRLQYLPDVEVTADAGLAETCEQLFEEFEDGN